jgi:hypothetical protein
MATQIQLRRDTAANWTSNNTVLAAGEFAWESDTNKFKIGDGTTAWTSLAYASDGDTAGITFVGDDSTGTLVAQNETFKIAGTQNITTAVAGDTLTITGPDLTGYSTFSGSYDDLTDKPTIPTNNTELSNGAGYITDYTVTEGDVTAHQAALSITESQITDLGAYITASSTDTLTNKSGAISQFTNDAGYLTSFTETNDLSSAVTWANVPDANITESSVTQHQAALSITESQVSDFGTYLTAETNDLSSAVTWANVPDVNITQSSVTQHQAALSVTESQISDLGTYLTAEANDLTSAVTWANVPNANITEGSVTQHQAALSITESQISDLSHFSGSYTDLTNKPTIPTDLTDLSITDGTSGQVLTTDGAGGFTFTTVAGGGGTITALNNQAENRITTIGSTTTELDGEANLTFDGSILTLTGQADIDYVRIKDNTITTNASNAPLKISANGTGTVALGAGLITDTALAFNVLQGGGASDRGATRSYLKTVDWSTASSGADRIYGNTDYMGITVSGSGTGNSRERVRQIQNIQIDSAGYNLPYSHGFYQANTNILATELRNSSAAASTVQEITGNSQFVKVGDNGTAGNLTVTDMTGNVSNLSIVAPTGTTMSVTNAFGAISAMEGHGGSGTTNLTNYYGFYVKSNAAGAPATNHYGFYVDDDAYINRLGGVTLQNGAISTDGITINDNNISTTRSNDSLNITANGTGRVMISANDSRGDNNILIASENPKNVMIYEDANAVFGQYNYANYIKGYYKIDSGQSNSTSSSDRYRNVLETELDLNGKDSTSTSTFLSRGPMGSNSLVRIRNTGGTDVTLGNANGGQNGLTVYANTTNNITVTEAAGHSSFVEGGTDTGLTAAFTEAHGYYSLGLQQFGSGTTTATTFTHFHAVPSVGTVTNEYAFYAEDAGMNNLIGGVTLLYCTG